MYTAKTADLLTLILTSQVRTDLNPMAHGANRETGGNALKHYNMLNIKASRLGDSAWKCGDIPPNSYVVKLQITKSKVKDRYRGNEIQIYFYKGSFDHKFNVVAIAKDLGLHDGKTIKYIDAAGVEQELKAKGFNDMWNNRINDEAISYLESKLTSSYTEQVMNYIPTVIGALTDDEEEIGEESGVL